MNILKTRPRKKNVHIVKKLKCSYTVNNVKNLAQI